MKLEKRSSFSWPATPNVPTAPCKNGLVAHYDGSDQGLAGKPHSACRTYWKNTRRFHMGTRGWSDIGYAYAVCPHQIVMEGRGFGRVQAAQPGGNSTWTSVTFMSGPGERPTDKQIQAFRELRAWLRSRGLKAAVKGHRDFISTSCPGTIIYGMVRDGTLAKPPAGGTTTKPAPRLLLVKTPFMRGDDVTLVQRQLNTHGAKPKVGVDGRYGPATEKALKAFQRAHGLDDDGIVGPKTRAALAKKP